MTMPEQTPQFADQLSLGLGSGIVDVDGEWGSVAAALRDPEGAVDAMELALQDALRKIHVFMTLKKAGAQTYQPNVYLQVKLFNALTVLLQEY
jgi:hypothetical protein